MPILRPLAATAATLLFSVAAHAELGGAASSLQSDRMQMKATVPAATSKLNYTVHEMTADNGATVREYIANDKVFAVAWHGERMPNLKQLMGPYFDTYTSEPRAKHAGHSHVAIEHADFVMHASGHMRSYSGSAYVPGLLPAGVKASDIQ